jgi:RimJ/RimL family protein N-acetyltransferase
LDEDLGNWKGCAEADVPRIRGRFVEIRPFEGRSDGLSCWRALGGPAANKLMRYFSNPDFPDGEAFSRWLETSQGALRTAVFLQPSTGEMMGMASYMRNDAANGCVEVGSIAHGSLMAATPAATEAQFLLASHVFENLGYRRYEWKCHNENEPSKRAAIRLGFAFEGVFRQHMVSRGRNRDTAWFAMIDKDWPAIRMAFEAWLDASNFDAKGRQIRRLVDMRRSTGLS